MVEYIYHHGIKGQKWGVRRYQNEDGSLTSAGKARYNDDGTKKDARKMTDYDLQKSNRRLQSEQTYNELTGKSYKNAGFVKSTAIRAGASAVGSFLAVGGTMAVKELVNKPWYSNPSDTLKKLKGPAFAGLLAASVASITSVATSLGGKVSKGDNYGKNG